MRFLYQQAPALPLTRISLIFSRTGSCLDPAEMQGLTRVMMRLMFRGAGGMSNHQIHEKLETLGASMGGGVGNDMVSMRLVTLTENLDAALDLFLTALKSPHFDGGEFQRLISELLSSWRSDREESKQVCAQEVYLSTLYGGAAQGFQPDGTETGLKAVTLEAAREKFLQITEGGDPILAVLSNLDEAAVKTRVLEKFSFNSRPKSEQKSEPYPWTSFQPSPPEGRKVMIVSDKSVQTDEIVIGGFSVSEKTEDWHIHHVISHLFGGDMNSRLFRKVRGERGLSYGASCWYESTHGRGPRDEITPFTLYTFPAIEHTAEALPLMVSLYEELVAKGVDEDELELTKNALSNACPFLRDTPQKLLGLQMEEALYGIKTDSEEVFAKKMLQVEAADVLRVLKETHHPEQMVITLLGDPKRLEPLASGLGGVGDLEVIQYL